MKRIVGCFAAVILSLAYIPDGFAGYCWVDNNTNGFSSPLNLSGSPMNGTLCGHTVYGTGTGGCVINPASVFYASNNADCLTLGSGVTVDASGTGGATIRCPADQQPCGKAISITNTSGSGNTKILGVDISGCFSYGVYGTIANAQELTNSYMGLGSYPSGSCPSGFQSTGVAGINVVNRAVISGATIGLDEGDKTVNDSIVAGCKYAAAGGGGGTMNNVSIHDNDTAFIRSSRTGNTHIKASTVLTGSGGSCATCWYPTGNTCTTESWCLIDFTGTNPTAYDYDLLP